MQRLPWVALARTAALMVALSACWSVGDTSVTTTKHGGILTVVSGEAGALADGKAAIEVQASVNDVAGDPLSGREVELQCEDANVLLIQPGRTDAAGHARGQVLSTAPGTKRLTAQFLDAGHRVEFLAPLSVSFLATEGTQPRWTLEVTPARAVANGAAPLMAKLMAVGLGDATSAGQKVTFSVGSVRDALSVQEAAVQADGSASTTLTSTLAGTRSLTATIGQLQVATPYTFVAGPADGGRSLLLVDRRDVGADGEESLDVRVFVRDAFDNPVVAQSVILASSVAGTTFVPAQGVSDGEGVLVAQMRSTSLGTVPIAVSFPAPSSALPPEATTGVQPAGPKAPAAPGPSLTGAATFVAGPPAASTSGLVAPSESTVADGASVAPLRLTLRDAAAHPVANRPVALEVRTPSTAASSESAQAVATASLTDANGVLQFEVKATAVGNVLVFATAQNLTLSAAVPFGAGPATIEASSLRPVGQQRVADGNDAATYVLQLRDAFSHPVKDQPVTLSTTLFGAVLQPTSGITDANGALQVTARGRSVGRGVVQAHFSGQTLSADLALVAGAPSSATSTLQVTPGQLVADDVATALVTLELRDAHGNLAAEVPANLVATGANVFVVGLVARTDTQGVLRATVSGSVAGPASVAVVLADGTLTTAFSLVAGAPDASRTTLAAMPNGGVTADANTASELILQARDRFGNPTAGHGVMLSADVANVHFGVISGTTDSTGTFRTWLTASTARRVVVNASLGSMYVQTPVDFVAGPPAAVESTWSSSPNVVVAGGDTDVTFLLRDAFGNSVSGANVSFAASGSSGSYGADTVTTDANGLAAGRFTSTRAEVKQLTVHVGALSFNTNVLFVAASPNATMSALSASLPQQVANNDANVRLTALVGDAYGNPVGGQTVTFSSSNGPANDTFTAPNATTDAAGGASTLLRSTLAGADTVTLAAGTAEVTTHITFLSGPAHLGRCSLVAKRASAPVDDANGVAVTAQVRDVFGNPVANTTVTFNADAPATLVGTATGSSDANGTVSATVRNIRPQIQVVAAEIASLGNVVTSVSFTPGTPAAVGLSASPNAAVNDDSDQITLTASCTDVYGNTVPSFPVSFAVGGSNNVLDSNIVLTNGAGVAAAQLRSTTAERKLVTAQADSAQNSATVYFTSTNAAPGQSSLSFAPAAGTAADQNAVSMATATLRDASGAALVNQTVTFSSLFDELAISPATAVTDANGVAKTALRSGLFGSKRLVVTAGRGALGGNVAFTALPAGARGALALPDLPSLTLGSDNQAFAAVALDINHDPWPDLVVATDSGALLSWVNQGNALFDAPVRTPALVGARSLVAADFTGDANVDVVAAAAQDRRVVLYPGLGHGAFLPGGRVLVSSTGPCYGTATGDFNEDGLPDLVASCRDGVGLRVFLGAGNGNFAAPQLLAVPGSPTFIAVGDVDHDGHADIVFTDASSADVQLYYGNGVGGFSPIQRVNCGGTNPAFVALTDFNGDQRLDIAVSAEFGYVTNATVLLAAPGRSFEAPRVYPLGGSGQSGIAVADVNQDGNKDILIGVSGPGGAVVLLGLGNGNFLAAPQRVVAANTRTYSLTVADFNLDGRDDLLVLAGTGPAGRSVASLSLGNARWLGPEPVAVGALPRALAGTDLNGDGYVDVLSSDQAAKTLSVVLNQNGRLLQSTSYALLGTPTGAPTAGDVTGDGVADVLVANANDANLSLLIGNGGGILAPAVGLPLGAATRAALLVQLTNDGKLDLVVANAASGGAVYSGGGSGNFTLLTTLASTATLTGLAAADVDADGNLDVLASSSVGLQLWRGLGDGNFAAAQAYGPSTAGLVVSPGTGDINGDGLQDVCVASPASNAIVVYLGSTSTTNTLSRQTSYALGDLAFAPTSARFADLNGDGLLDIVFGVYHTSTVRVRLGNGDGTFGPVQPYIALPVPQDIAVADFDHDGRTDFVVGSDNSQYGDYSAPLTNRLAVYTNVGPLPMPAGRPLASLSTLSASTTSRTTDNNSTINLSLALNDLFGSRVAGQAVTVVATGTNTVVGQPNGTTAADGTFSADLRSTTAQTQAVVLIAGLATFPLTVTFTPGVPVAANSSLLLSPNSVIASDHNDTVAQVTAVVRDAHNNLVPNSAVSLAASGANNTFVPASGSTDANGTFVSALYSPVAQNKMVTLTLAAGATLAGNVTFAAASPNAVRSSLLASPNEQVAGNANGVVLALTARDAYGNPVGGANVTFSTSGGNVAFAPLSATTAADGTLQTVLTTTSARIAPAVASFAGLGNVSTSTTFVAAPAAFSTSSLSALPGAVVADGQELMTLRGRLMDTYGNVCVGQASSLVTTGANVTFAPGSHLVADANGVVVITATTPTVQTAFFSLQQNAATFASVAANFTLGPPYAATSTLLASPNQGLSANGTAAAQLTGTMRDILARPLAGKRVFLSTPEPGVRLSAKAVTTDSNGSFGASAINLTSKRAGLTQAVALCGNASLQANVSFSALASACSTAPLLPDRPGPFYVPTSNSGAARLRVVNWNNDAYADVVVALAGSNANNVYGLLGSGNGLVPAPAFSWTVSGTPRDFVIDDFDGAGRPDLAIVNTGTGLSTIKDAGQMTYTMPFANAGLCSGAIDSGNQNDLVILAASPNSGYSVLLNLGNGNFLTQGYSALGSSLTSCGLADLDHDSFTDLVVTDAGQQNVLLLTGAGNGSFTLRSRLPVGGCSNLNKLQLTDLNGDGWADIAVVCSNQSVGPSGNYVRVWLNDQTGNYPSSKVYGTLSGISSLAVTDVNADGNADLLSASRNGRIFQFTGSGGGNFAAVKNIGTPAAVNGVEAGDFNGDGNLELVYAMVQPQALGVLTAGAAHDFPSLTTLPPGLTSTSYNITAIPAQRLVPITDINGDGLTDFVTMKVDAFPNIHVSMGDGNYVSYSIDVGYGFPWAAAAGDVLGNGSPRLMLGYYYIPSIVMCANSGNGVPTSGKTVVTMPAGRFWGLDSADINNDGIDDLVASTRESSATIQSFLSLGDGNFVAGSAIDIANAAADASSDSASLQLIDVDNNGTVDLITISKSNVTIFLNGGGGLFTLSQRLAVPQRADFFSVVRASLGDINGDGYVDIVTGSNWNAPWILTNNKNGTFTAQSSPSTSSGSFSTMGAVLVDVDQDGRLDVLRAVSSYGYSGVYDALGFTKGNGDGTFSAQETFYPSNSVHAMVSGRGAADGRPVVVTSNRNDATLLMRIPSGCSP